MNGFWNYLTGNTRRQIEELQDRNDRLRDAKKDNWDLYQKADKDLAGSIRKYTELEASLKIKSKRLEDLTAEFASNKELLAEAVVVANMQEEKILRHINTANKFRKQLAEKDEAINELISKNSALELKIKELQTPKSPLAQKVNSVKGTRKSRVRK